MQTSEHYKKGLDILKQIDEENYEAIVDSFKQSIAPDLGCLLWSLITDRFFQDRALI